MHNKVISAIRLQILKQSSYQFHGQAHYVCHAAFDTFDEFVAVFLDGVRPGFVLPGAACDVGCDLIVGEFTRVDNSAVAFDYLGIIAQSNKSHARDNLVRSAE